MKVLFVGQIIPNNIYNRNHQLCQKVIGSAANVFYNALLRGISENGVEVSCRMTLPEGLSKDDNDTVKDGMIWKQSKYVSHILLRIIKNFFVTGYDVLRWSRTSGKDDLVIFNVLRISQSIGGLMMCKILGLKTLTVVTDVPGYRIQTAKRSVIAKAADLIGQKIIAAFDYYVFLSEAMKDVVPIGEKPYTVIEGIYDEQQTGDLFDGDAVQDKRFVVLYAGSLHYKYGIMNLVHAVQSLGDNDIELHVYGNGEAAEEIVKLSEEFPNIQYKGNVSHDEILRLERKASLLVNPRPVDDEYVKYSFPSKNMEYMASGTPVLLTDIPSLPEEYREYVTTIPDNRIQSIAKKIDMIKRTQDNKYLEKAFAAREFIIHNKNKRLQAKKLLELI